MPRELERHAALACKYYFESLSVLSHILRFCFCLLLLIGNWIAEWDSLYISHLRSSFLPSSSGSLNASLGDFASAFVTSLRFICL